MANEIKKRFAKECLTEIVPATPVDTGQARSNWNIGLGAPDYSTRATEGRSGDGALQRGVQKISGATYGQGIHISNGLPYINRLNNGWSKQAPSGYIEQSIETARGRLRRIKWGEYEKAAKSTGGG